MSQLKFNPNYKSWKHEFDTVPVYTRKQLHEELDKLRKKLIISRVIRCPTGRIDDEREALQILAIHETELGLMILVK